MSKARTSAGEEGHHRAQRRTHSPSAPGVAPVRPVLPPGTSGAVRTVVAVPTDAATGTPSRFPEGVKTRVAVAEAGMDVAVAVAEVKWIDGEEVAVGDIRCRLAAAAVAGAAEENSHRSWDSLAMGDRRWGRCWDSLLR